MSLEQAERTRKFFKNPTPTEWGNQVSDRIRHAGGRLIYGDTYEELVSQLREDELLFIVHHRSTSGRGDIAPHIDSKDTFEMWESRRKGKRQLLVFKQRPEFSGSLAYAVPNNLLDNLTYVE